MLRLSNGPFSCADILQLKDSWLAFLTATKNTDNPYLHHFHGQHLENIHFANATTRDLAWHYVVIGAAHGASILRRKCRSGECSTLRDFDFFDQQILLMRWWSPLMRKIDPLNDAQLEEVIEYTNQFFTQMRTIIVSTHAYKTNCKKCSQDLFDESSQE